MISKMRINLMWEIIQKLTNLGVLKLLTNFFDVRGSERVRTLRVVILYIKKICIILNGNSKIL